MKYTAPVAGLLALAALPVVAQGTTYELDLSTSYDWRGGADLNGSGPPQEIEDFALGQIGLSVATPLQNGLLLQTSARYDQSFADTELYGSASSDDTYAYGLEANLQLGQSTDTRYFGGYASFGEVGFNPDDTDQNTRFYSLGAQAAWAQEDWVIGGTVGLLQSRADNPESIDNAVLLGLNGAYYFNEGDTRVSASLGWMNGDQDTDSGSGPDPVTIWSAGFEIQHTLATRSSHTIALYTGVDWLEVREGSSGGSTEVVNDTIFTAGLRMRFGAGHQAQARTNTPPLPDMLRAIGAVVAVD